jgi:ribonuclease G
MKKILITVRPWETRVALVYNDLLQNIYFDSKASKSLEKSFFKGVVAKVLPGVQTAFINIKQERAGFLHISEIDRDLAFKKIKIDNEEDDIEEESIQHKNHNIREIDISKILKQNDPILVQVSKEPINEKGAKLTTCFMLPGRFVVLMPNIPKVGISKRIVDVNERKRLKDLVLSVLPEQAGCIIRTTSEGISDEDIVQDVQYLLEVWTEIQEQFKTAPNESCLHQDINLYLQIIRDHLDSSVEKIICDDKEVYENICNFVKKIAPHLRSRVIYHKESIPLFESYNIEKQIQNALYAKVELPSGGSIVIDKTEAMTVIDVNTGRFVGATRLEDTLLKVNMEAAFEVVRQLRLRNIGGLIVIDFIDMVQSQNRHKLFNYFEQTLKEYDKSQSVVLKISEFGLVQMTRKRTGKTLNQQLLQPCPTCHGIGEIKSLHTRVYELFKNLEHFLASKNLQYNKELLLIITPQIAEYLIEYEYDSLITLEKQYKIKIKIRSEENFSKLYHFELS